MKQDHFKRAEQRYLFPAGYKEMNLAWLDHVWMPDPRYPSSSVFSLYYDTPGLFHFHESRNGDFLRTKVRLRWYSDIPPMVQNTGVRCYLEIKRKQGALSEKKRFMMTIPARTHFDVGVLETKGMNRGIPGVLNPIAFYLTKSPFSKYGIGLESLMHPLGRRV